MSSVPDTGGHPIFFHSCRTVLSVPDTQWQYELRMERI